MSDVREVSGKILVRLQRSIGEGNRELVRLRRTCKDISTGVIKLDDALMGPLQESLTKDDMAQIRAWFAKRRKILAVMSAEAHRLARMAKKVEGELSRLRAISRKAAVKKAGLKDGDGGMDAEWCALWAPASHMLAPADLDDLIRKMTAWADRFGGSESEQGEGAGSYRAHKRTIARVVRLAETLRELYAGYGGMDDMIRKSHAEGDRPTQAADRASTIIKRTSLDEGWRAEEARLKDNLGKADAGIATLRGISRGVTAEVATLEVLISECGPGAGLGGLAEEVAAARTGAERLIMGLRKVRRYLKKDRVHYRKISRMVDGEDVFAALPPPPQEGGTEGGQSTG